MNELKKLIKVKSIVTIILTIVFSFEVIKGNVEIDQIYLMIIAFYFGTQTEKRSDINV